MSTTPNRLSPSRHNFSNRILQNLSDETVSRLGLKVVTLPVGREIEAIGKSIRHVFFLESGAASMTATFKDGKQTEVGLFGFEGAIGISALMGTKRSLNRVYMQIAGHGLAAPVESCRHEFDTNSNFRDLMLRYVQTQLIQAMQSAGCNLSHHLEQRLARWLLLCADRSRADVFVLSQQFLAMMLGVRRSSVNLALGNLVDKQLIAIKRNQIALIDKVALERHACECYLVVKHHLDNFIEFDDGQTEYK